MSKYLLSFFAGLFISFVVLFFVKLFNNTVQRHDVAIVVSSLVFLLMFFGYYVFQRIGSSPKK